VKNIQPDMNVEKQIRKFDAAIEAAPSPEHAGYLTGLLAMFLVGVSEGQPQPFSQFIPMYEEEFDL
jgi:hypothetical protein